MSISIPAGTFSPRSMFPRRGNRSSPVDKEMYLIVGSRYLFFLVYLFFLADSKWLERRKSLFYRDSRGKKLRYLIVIMQETLHRYDYWNCWMIVYEKFSIYLIFIILNYWEKMILFYNRSWRDHNYFDRLSFSLLTRFSFQIDEIRKVRSPKDGTWYPKKKIFFSFFLLFSCFF